MTKLKGLSSNVEVVKVWLAMTESHNPRPLCSLARFDMTERSTNELCVKCL